VIGADQLLGTMENDLFDDFDDDEYDTGEDGDDDELDD